MDKHLRRRLRDPSLSRQERDALYERAGLVPPDIQSDLDRLVAAVRRAHGEATGRWRGADFHYTVPVRGTVYVETPLSVATIVVGGVPLAEGLQPASVSDEASQAAHEIAQERGEPVVLEDSDGTWTFFHNRAPVRSAPPPAIELGIDEQIEVPYEEHDDDELYEAAANRARDWARSTGFYDELMTDGVAWDRVVTTFYGGYQEAQRVSDQARESATEAEAAAREALEAMARGDFEEAYQQSLEARSRESEYGAAPTWERFSDLVESWANVHDLLEDREAGLGPESWDQVRDELEIALENAGEA